MNADLVLFIVLGFVMLGAAIIVADNIVPHVLGSPPTGDAVEKTYGAYYASGTLGGDAGDGVGVPAGANEGESYGGDSGGSASNSGDGGGGGGGD